MVKDVTLYGDPILRKKCRPVTDFGELEPIIDDMFETMYEEEGIGLAANQIGLDLNLMVIDVSHADETDEVLILVNSSIVDSEGESIEEEGCLSLPNIRFDVKRPESITLKYQTIDGIEQTETFDGLTARVIQHEIDHLNGVLIIDRTNQLNKLKFGKELKEIENHSKTAPPK